MRRDDAFNLAIHDFLPFCIQTPQRTAMFALSVESESMFETTDSSLRSE
jgi:hypothetical protein